ncbi:MAG: hypothetical protein D6767_10600 [Candidatus Hydrogenedentota bacterium]|nr:MAG: hypothetical protein D6767_10600 [Candidatus Hydrogenedentota bacterium]
MSNALFARQLRLKKLRLHSLLKQATENHVNTPLFFYAQFCKSFQKNYCPYPAHFTKYLKPYFGRSQIFKPYQNQCIKKWIFIKKETPQSIRQTLPKVLQGKSGLFRCVFGQWRRVTEIAIENPAKWQKKIQQQWILSPS